MHFVGPEVALSLPGAAALPLTRWLAVLEQVRSEGGQGMQILTVQLGCVDIDVADEFYRALLGLKTSRVDGTLHVSAGWTEMVLTPGPQPGVQHIAFTIPRNRFAEAKRWPIGRLTLLRTDEGDEFEGPTLWNSRSLYFEDPDRNVLEFIIRRELPNDASGAFSGGDILGVSEVGVPVADVAAFRDAARAELGLEPYCQGGATFRPIGDVNGLLIVVKRGRAWFPTDLSALDMPLEVTIESGPHAELEANDSCVIRAR